MKVEWIKIPVRPVSAQAKRAAKNNYIEVVQRCAKPLFPKPWCGSLSVQIFYVIARPSDNRNLSDLDNFDKLLLDALKAIAYVDDRQIYSKKSERIYCGDRVVTSAGIMPSGNKLQETAQLKKEECTFIGITDVLL
jgi:Holliday junction resolvase RusA-like endonuclease